MLQRGHLVNCYNGYNKRKYLSKYLYLGYMEACLVQFGVIESKENGLEDYTKKIKVKGFFKTYEIDETREQTIIRLVKEYLETI